MYHSTALALGSKTQMNIFITTLSLSFEACRAQKGIGFEREKSRTKPSPDLFEYMHITGVKASFQVKPQSFEITIKIAKHDLGRSRPKTSHTDFFKTLTDGRK